MRLLTWTKVTYRIKGCTTKSVLLTGCKSRTHSWIAQTRLQGCFKATGKRSSRILGAETLNLLSAPFSLALKIFLMCPRAPTTPVFSWNNQQVFSSLAYVAFAALVLSQQSTPLLWMILRLDWLSWLTFANKPVHDGTWQHLQMDVIMPSKHGSDEKGRTIPDNTFWTWLELPRFDSPE